jgi:TolB-like protein
MAAETNSDVEFEIGHVLFIDIVGYSKLLIHEQSEQLQKLREIVRATEQFRAAQAEGKLLRLPTGDGGALVFGTSPEAPVTCALETSRALKNHPQLRVRMGIHSGPVREVTDLNEQANIAGAGINIAQRVMDCGDAGHILLSKHIAEDLEEYQRWRPLLHDLGTCEVKHGVRVGIMNLYTDEVGNRQLPKKFQVLKKHRTRLRWTAFAAALLLLGAIIAAFVLVSRRPAASISGIPEKSIAVLPFENLSEEKANAFFADGVQDEIMTNLAKIADLKVISRTSVMQYKNTAKRDLREIARTLAVAHVLEGSVQRAANRVRVNAQLIDARSDAHLWAETFDRDLVDVFAIQSEIAKTIADHLQARLSPIEKAEIEKPPTTNLAAYDQYLRAQALYADTTDQSHARENLPQCVGLLDEAVAHDPNFVAAWCLLSNVHGTFYYLGLDHTPDRLQKANAAVQAALRIDSNSGEAHLAYALYHYRGFRDFTRARAELAVARRTLPNNAAVFFFSGVFDYRQGDWGTATHNIERAVELDPRNLLYVQQMALCYQPQRRYADELRMWDRALSIVPGDGVSRMGRAQVAANARGDMKPYQETLAALLAENPEGARELDDPLYALRERTPAAAARMLRNYSADGTGAYGINFPHSYWEGVVARWEGDKPKAVAAFTVARQQLEKISQTQPDFAAALSLLGLIDAGLGRKDDAVREARRACELLPISKDAVDGVAFVVNLAQVYAWVGEKDLALEQLAVALKVPNDCHYGELLLHPHWDPLRDDPRFQKIVASQAPKN